MSDKTALPRTPEARRLKDFDDDYEDYENFYNDGVIDNDESDGKPRKAKIIEEIMKKATASRGENVGKHWNDCDFDLGETLGMGTFGVVRRAKERTTGFIVALKNMSAESKSDWNKKEILREIEIQSRLTHPNILKLYNYYLGEGGTLTLILEYAAKATLLDILLEASSNNTVIAPELAAKYIFEIASALDYCHYERDVIHRDLKPENVLIDINGSAKLADFGGSVHAPNRERGSFVGTLAYMAPEVISGGWYLFDVDLWSLGVCAYALCSSVMPFAGETREQLQAAILENKVCYPKYMPEGAVDLIKKLLRTNPAERISLVDVQNHPWIIEMFKKLLASSSDNSCGGPPAQLARWGNCGNLGAAGTYDVKGAGAARQSGGSSNSSYGRQPAGMARWGNCGDLRAGTFDVEDTEPRKQLVGRSDDPSGGPPAGMKRYGNFGNLAALGNQTYNASSNEEQPGGRLVDSCGGPPAGMKRYGNFGNLAAIGNQTYNASSHEQQPGGRSDDSCGGPPAGMKRYGNFGNLAALGNQTYNASSNEQQPGGRSDDSSGGPPAGMKRYGNFGNLAALGNQTYNASSNEEQPGGRLDDSCGGPPAGMKRYGNFGNLAAIGNQTYNASSHEQQPGGRSDDSCGGPPAGMRRYGNLENLADLGNRTYNASSDEEPGGRSDDSCGGPPAGMRRYGNLENLAVLGNQTYNASSNEQQPGSRSDDSSGGPPAGMKRCGNFENLAVLGNQTYSASSAEECFE